MQQNMPGGKNVIVSGYLEAKCNGELRVINLISKQTSYQMAVVNLSEPFGRKNLFV